MYFSMNQAKSIRWNVFAGTARSNPQGLFKYDQITVTDVYVLLSRSPELINGKLRTMLNGILYLAPVTPLKLAQQFGLPGVYKLDFPMRMMDRSGKLDTSLINGTYKGFMEIIFQNNGSTVQNYHMDGYAFFVVFPGAWTAILVSLDNVGIWNLRTENLDSWYLGLEVYVSVINSEITYTTELAMPDNIIFCGELSSFQQQQFHKFSYSGTYVVPSISWTDFFVILVFWFSLVYA